AAFAGRPPKGRHATFSRLLFPGVRRTAHSRRETDVKSALPVPGQENIPALLSVAEQQQLSAVYMQRLLEVAQEYGVDGRVALRSVGLTPEMLQRRGARCTVGQRLRVLEYVRNARHIPGLGLLVGVRIMIHDHGIVGYAILSSARLRDAMNIIARYHQLSNPAVRFSYHVEGDDVVIREAPILPFDEYAQVYHLEEMLAAWI